MLCVASEVDFCYSHSEFFGLHCLAYEALVAVSMLMELLERNEVRLVLIITHTNNQVHIVNYDKDRTRCSTMCSELFGIPMVLFAYLCSYMQCYSLSRRLKLR